MSRPTLSARSRAARGKQNTKLRSSGMLPGVVYGRGRESQMIELDTREFETLQRHSGRHAVLDLKVEGGGKSQPVLLQAVQEHPVTRRPLHIDLLVVNLEEERTVDAPIVIVGESQAIERLGGVLLHLRDAVLVRAKPDDLPSGIELDITPLEDFDAVLHVSDLKVPEGVTMVTDPSEPVARVQAPRIEEEPVAAEVAEGEAEADTTAEGETAAESSGAEGSSGEGSES